MNGKADIHLKNCDRLKEVDQATYLGGIISKKCNRMEEMSTDLAKLYLPAISLNKTGTRRTARTNGNSKSTMPLLLRSLRTD